MSKTTNLPEGHRMTDPGSEVIPLGLWSLYFRKCLDDGRMSRLWDQECIPSTVGNGGQLKGFKDAR